MKKWYLYWATVSMSLFGLAWWRNNKKYPEQTRSWVITKAAADTALVGLFAWLCPPLLFAYIVLKILNAIPRIRDNKIFNLCASVFTGTALTVVGGWFLEAVLVAGVWAMDLLTGEAVRIYRKHKEFDLRRAA